jgi:regulator of protease activity HflC (stomatin/prohibitin superfamily)
MVLALAPPAVSPPPSAPAEVARAAGPPALTEADRIVPAPESPAPLQDEDQVAALDPAPTAVDLPVSVIKAVTRGRPAGADKAAQAKQDAARAEANRAEAKAEARAERIAEAARALRRAKIRKAERRRRLAARARAAQPVQQQPFQPFGQPQIQQQQQAFPPFGG